ncbi:MAG: RNA methyltransferase [Cyclobacteriaceae bacterium]|nr:RNA methyltransferase [Cyclobacteriaceae bacterium]
MNSSVIGLIEFLKPYVTEHKQKLVEKVLEQRTRHITVVLENIYHPHNASAVVRSCDCFGVQDVHVIEGHNEYNINPYVVRGSAKWISIHKYPLSELEDSCYDQLKNQGYKLIGTTPDPSYKSIRDIDSNAKIALVFGTEETGLSKYAMEQMDDYAHIPMHGFTESFNLSVSAAICLYESTLKMRGSNVSWQLSENEKNELRLQWYKNIIARSDVLEREYARICSET